MKNPPRPLAPHVQNSLKGPAACVQAMMARGNAPAPHVLAAVQRCQVLQARTAGPAPRTSAQALARLPVPTQAIQPAKPAVVIQRSLVSDVSSKIEIQEDIVPFKIEIQKGNSSQKPSGTEVKQQDIHGKEGYAYSGLYTKGVRNCVVFCMFGPLPSEEFQRPLQAIFMLHVPLYNDILSVAPKVIEKWNCKAGFQSYIIGGNDEKSFQEDFKSGKWTDLKIAHVESPLTKRGSFANIEIKGSTITYWILDDEESTEVNLIDKNTLEKFGFV